MTINNKSERNYRGKCLGSPVTSYGGDIKKFKRKRGEKWLCVREISSSSAICYKLGDTFLGLLLLSSGLHSSVCTQCQTIQVYALSVIPFKFIYSVSDPDLELRGERGLFCLPCWFFFLL